MYNSSVCLQGLGWVTKISVELSSGYGDKVIFKLVATQMVKLYHDYAFIIGSSGYCRS